MKANLNFLVAEDNSHDIFALKRVWKKLKITSALNIVKNGEECIAYLNRQDKYRNTDFPDILFLDINMPKLDGYSVLKYIRSHEKFRFLPVIIMTTSNYEVDRKRSYMLGANAYILKPMKFELFADVIERIVRFWEIVELQEVL